ncbi:putative DNA primase/helicase [Paraburkholderia atlantica]|uniref:AAA family ATPase n=1 Tax=Paraburkholderia atlantica TaxID=2654982 RepID=UPI003D1ACBA7
MSAERDGPGSLDPGWYADQLERSGNRRAQIEAAEARAAKARAANSDAAVAADAKPNGKHDHVDEITVEQAESMNMKHIEFLWPGYIARGAVHVLAGNSGEGKSTLISALVAVFTTGGRLPDGSQAPLCNVLIYSGEEGIEDTLLPRLRGMGADMSRIYIPKARRDPAGRITPFDPSTDMALLKVAVAEHDIGLVIIDPIMDVMSAGSGNDARDVRHSLDPVKELAEVTAAAIIGVTHFGKTTKDRTLEARILGSQAWVAVARSCLVVVRESDSERRVLLRAKTNIARREGGVVFHLAPISFDWQGETFDAMTVQWGRELSGAPAKIAEAIESEPSKDERRDAMRTFVHDLFDGRDEVPSSDIEAQAKACGLSYRGVQKIARDEMGVLIRRSGSSPDDPWMWRVPPTGLRNHPGDRLAPFYRACKEGD